MADVCEFCPFMGCHDCRYPGGGPLSRNRIAIR